MTKVIKYEHPERLNKADVKPKIKTPARNTAKLGGIKNVESTGAANHPNKPPVPETGSNHPPFVNVDKSGDTWWGVTRPGTAWTSTDQGATWKPLRVPRERSGNVDMYESAFRPARTPRANWIAASTMPQVAGGERKQHDARLTWAPRTKATPSK